MAEIIAIPDRRVLADLVESASEQFQLYEELNLLRDLADIFQDKPPDITNHNWDFPLELVWNED